MSEKETFLRCNYSRFYLPKPKPQKRDKAPVATILVENLQYNLVENPLTISDEFNVLLLTLLRLFHSLESHTIWYQIQISPPAHFFFIIVASESNLSHFLINHARHSDEFCLRKIAKTEAGFFFGKISKNFWLNLCWSLKVIRFIQIQLGLSFLWHQTRFQKACIYRSVTESL